MKDSLQTDTEHFALSQQKAVFLNVTALVTFHIYLFSFIMFSLDSNQRNSIRLVAFCFVSFIEKLAICLQTPKPLRKLSANKASGVRILSCCCCIAFLETLPSKLKIIKYLKPTIDHY